MIAQITIIGMLGLKRSSYSSIAMIFLLVLTMLFTYSIKREHFKLAMILSAKECAIADIANAEEQVDWNFLRGKYVQPELQERRVTPVNALPERQLSRDMDHAVDPLGDLDNGR